jgi:hypothetical protein
MTEEIKKIFDTWGQDTVIAIQATLTAQRSVATAQLRASIKYALGEDFVQFTMLEYGQYLETGTRPHWVPIGPLKRWATIKGMSKSAPYAIRASIKKKGTRAHPFFSSVIEREIERLLPQLDQGFIKYLDGRITLLQEQANAT